MSNDSFLHLRRRVHFGFTGHGLVLLLLLLASTVCPAAISFVQQNYAVPQSPTSTVSVAYAAAQLAGDTNIVAVGWSDSTSSIISVADTRGNVYALAIGPTRQSGVQSQSIYVAKNVVAAAAGQNTVNVVFSAAVAYPDVRILSYRGLDTTAPVEVAVGAVGNGTSSNSGSLTTTNANDLLFAANYVTSGTSAAGTGYTKRVITSPDGNIAQDRVVTTAGTYSAAASMSSGGWVMQLVALKAAGSQPTVATPAISPGTGTYNTVQSVSLSDSTAGATIYYTTDNSTPVIPPNSSTSQYIAGTQIPVATNGMTIKAIASATGYLNSAVASATYTLVVAQPAFNPAPGTYTSTQPVTLLDATPNATIYYTTDNSNPTTSSPVFNSSTPITVSATTTIKAMATASFGSSTVASGTYTIQLPTTATPTITPGTGTYNTTQSVALSDATSGATIYYTTDNSTPTNPPNSKTFTYNATQIPVTTNGMTIKAIASSSGNQDSAVASATYTLVAAQPAFSPAPGNYVSPQPVTISDATPNSTIYYTTDNSNPTTSSLVYNNTPIAVNANTTIKAMATANGFGDSTVASGTYTIGANIPIAFVQVNYAVPQTSPQTVNVTYPAAQSAGNANVVAIGWSNSTSSVTSVTDTTGNVYGVAAGPTAQSGVQSLVIYIAKNIASAAAGANTVKVTFSSTVPYPDVRVLEYSGLDPVSPSDGSAAASGSGLNASSGSIATTNAYDLIFSADYVTSSTSAGGTGFTTRVITIPDGDIAEDRIVTATGSYAGTATLGGSGSWIMQAVALRGVGAPPLPPDPSIYGQWGPVTAWPVLPIHVTLMPNGKVLAFGHDATNNSTAATVWDPATSTFTNASYATADLFCAGHGLLPDGRVFIAGGHNKQDYVGLKNATVFDPATSKFSALSAMSYARWYPTVTSLPDGRMLVSSGSINCNGCNATIPEIYNPTTNSWTQLSSASLDIPIYPHMFVLPDGRVLNTGSYELPVATRALNISTQTWTTIDPTVLDAGSAVMYLPGKILKTGASANSDPPYTNSATTAYVLDMTQGSPAWRAASSMAFARAYHNMTVLPDGNVLVTGGVATTNPDDQATSAFAAEMWSPSTERFVTLAAMVTPRVYHSMALLLPDGRVMVGGGGEYHGSSPDQLNAEIYSPPYLFKGARPAVTSYPATLQYGAPFAVQSPDAASISSVVLVRLGSVTHAFNENQRYVPLTFTASSGSLTVQAPANANLAPPGYYMLFVVNNAGVPSVGVFVRF